MMYPKVRIRAALVGAVGIIMGAAAAGESLGQAAPTNAEAASLTIPCALPQDAVKAVPAPLDHYVTLVCTRGGQALKPVDGSNWVFDTGATWLSASNPKGPAQTDHYTELANKPLSQPELAALRSALSTLKPAPEVLTRNILRFAVTTSWGAHKEIYLLPPPDGAGADARTLGMECIHGCRPIDKDPWFFTIAPNK